MSKDYEYMLKAYAESGGAPEVFKDSRVAHLVVHKNKVYGSHTVKGLVLEPRETETGVDISLLVEKGQKIEYPVHLCFGVLPDQGVQEIRIRAKIEDGAGVSLLAHCIFPNAVNVVHRMEAEIEIGNNAFYEYNEVHYHGTTGGVEVVPKAKVKVGDKSYFRTNFSLIKGRVGVFDLDYEADVGESSVLEMTARIFGYGDDRIKIREVGRLSGKGSRGLLKSRVAVKDNAQSEIFNELVASAPEARGHVDCVEIVQGNARAKATPIVSVLNEFARVTHEAAIGRVDKKQVETLMARGLEEEKAIDLVISGMLK
ncbi:MAG: SufD family Fe-S cluster assembly protein [Caldiserica bacterium]|jgi:Fe-S cluster assembly scaffold protein SufB|nr:SufD family Fe-S cluster assembly protein [Caldisericota bacterium]